MNKAILCGRLTKDPETRVSGSGILLARYTLAVDRRVKGEEKQADFIQCICFGKGAEFAQNYLRKGMRILVEGHIQTGSYTDKDGRKVYTTDICIENQEFAESKSAGERKTGSRLENTATAEAYSYDSDGWGQIPEGADDTGLPFN